MGDASAGSELPKAISHSFISASSRISSDLGSNVVSELLGLFEQAGVIGVFLRCQYQGRGDGLAELGEIGSIWTGLGARRDHCVTPSPIRSRRPASRACLVCAGRSPAKEQPQPKLPGLNLGGRAVGAARR